MVIDAKTAGVNQDQGSPQKSGKMSCPVTWGAGSRETTRLSGLQHWAMCLLMKTSPAGLAPRQALPMRLSFPDAQAALRGPVSLASHGCWGWPAVSRCVCVQFPRGAPSQPATPPSGRGPWREARLQHGATVCHFLASCDRSEFQEASSAGPQRGHLVLPQTLLT